MAVTVFEIAQYLDRQFPAWLAEDWDNTGLLAGDRDREVSKVLTALDVTGSVIEEAVNMGIDLIVSHHPVIFKPLKSITDASQKGTLLLKAIRSGIAIYCMHTNYDAAENGLNTILAKELELENIRGLNEYKRDPAYSKERHWLGRIGDLKEEMDLDIFIAYIKEKLSADSLKLAGSGEGKIRKVAVFCGSFDGDFSGIHREKPDILITGEIKYHDALEMAESGCRVLQAGHYHSEKFMEKAVARIIKDEFPLLEVLTARSSADVFRFY